MALFAIADLHLSIGENKKMDKFRGWEGYEERLTASWNAIVKPTDTVVIAGDISWAMKLTDTLADFTFLHGLPGRKLLMKGNHDYWWCTKKKMDDWLASNGFDDMSILFNNAFACGNYAVCGTRGWSYDCPENEQNVLLREVGRLETSIRTGIDMGLEPLVFLHYPPVYGDYVCGEIMEVLRRYGIKKCLYGHLHGAARGKAVTGDYEGIQMRLISADHVGFIPQLILPDFPASEDHEHPVTNN